MHQGLGSCEHRTLLSPGEAVSCGAQAHCEQESRHVWRICLVLVLLVLCCILCFGFCDLAFVLYFRPHFVLHLKLNLYYILKGEFFEEVLLVHSQVGSCYTFICYYILRCLCGKSLWVHLLLYAVSITPSSFVTISAGVTLVSCYCCCYQWNIAHASLQHV